MHFINVVISLFEVILLTVKSSLCVLNTCCFAFPGLLNANARYNFFSLESEKNIK